MPIDPKSIKWDDITWDDAPKEPSWRDLPGNILPSAGRFAGGLVDAVMSPLKTAGTLMDAAAGGLRNLTPEALRALIDKADTVPGSPLADPEASLRASGVADAVGKMYRERYGGAENIKRTAITDPVGAAADLSTLLTGGALATSRVAPGLSSALGQGAKYTNPLSVIPPVAKATGKLAATAIGELGTHTGGKSLTAAAEAGAKGDSSFLANMRGQIPFADVVEKAKEAVANMGRQKSAAYEQNMAGVRGDNTVLKFDGIDDAVRKAGEIGSYKGVVKNERAAAAVQKMADDVAEWKSLDPAQFHTPQGLDALKQRLGGVLESIPFEEKSARLAAGKIYAAVKEEISKQAPGYAKTMRQYEEASDLIREIERALSLGQRASADTALRKLQSVMRNNANTNYGGRADLLGKLEAAGGQSLSPALAGQSLGSWAPRGLGKLAASATAGYGLTNPAAFALLPMQSPRLMGEAAYATGRLGGLLGNVPREAILGLGQAGLLGER